MLTLRQPPDYYLSLAPALSPRIISSKVKGLYFVLTLFVCYHLAGLSDKEDTGLGRPCRPSPSVQVDRNKKNCPPMLNLR